MRKPGLLFLYLLLMLMPLGATGIDIFGTVDLTAMDSFFCEGKRVSAELGVHRDQVGITIPISYGFSLDEEIGVTDIALSLRLYPIHDMGLYFATDIFSWIHIFGADSPEGKDIFPSSFTVGYTFRHGYFLVEPEIVFQNPLRLEVSTLSYLADRFLSYMDFYLALKLGASFTI